MTTETSLQAAAAIKPRAGAMREQIHAHIEALGLGGATCDEIEASLDFKHQTASARIRELVKAMELFDSGIRRPTRSGSLAIVWTTFNNLPLSVDGNPLSR